jgi:transcriptional regulator with XRE-family HTH domain
MAIGTDLPDTAPPATDDGLRRRELADFLRRRRARISPEEVGLAIGGRRRTPGLRREEVAQLSGVGVTWYTWLEQGRDIRASEQVLDSICRTLMLDAHEREHVFTLAGAPGAVTIGECDAVSGGVLAIVEHCSPYPAAVFNGRYDILTFNRPYAGLLGDVGALPFDERNTLWLMFTHPDWRALLGPSWETATRRCVAQYRRSLADHVSEPAWQSLVKRLRAVSPEFEVCWREHDVAPTENVTKTFLHPALGPLHFQATNLWLAQGLANRMVVYSPADGSTESVVGQLATIPPRSLLSSPAA